MSLSLHFFYTPGLVEMYFVEFIIMASSDSKRAIQAKENYSLSDC